MGSEETWNAIRQSRKLEETLERVETESEYSCHTVQYRDHEVRGFWPQIITPKPA